MSLLTSWRTSLRVARREAGRAKGRSALVVAMIAFPMLWLSFAAVSYDMFTLTGAEQADRSMGQADARIIWAYDTPVEQDVRGENFWPVSTNSPEETAEPATPTRAELSAKLPAGTSVLSLRKGAVALRTATGTGELNAISVDATGPLTEGYVEVLAGRAPTAATEVALTEQATGRLGAGLGGTVISADGKRSYQVVGLVEFPSALEQLVLFAPITEERPAGFSLGQVWLADTPEPVTWQQVRELNTWGIVVASREVFVNPPPAGDVPRLYDDEISTEELGAGVFVAGAALLEIVLLAGPAFAVSARRRQRQLALVAANGGTPAHVRRIVLADGIVLGCVGAGVGIVAGIITAFVARPFAEELLAHARAGGYRVFPTALVAIACLAVVTGLLAAVVPAFVTARQNVVAALAGRRGVTRSRKRWIVLSLAMIALGSAVVVGGTLTRSAQIMLAGLIVGELGLVLCTPALVGLVARIGRILPVAPRIALRDAARNRAAAAPAISAVMAAVAGSVAIGLYVDSAWGQQSGDFRPAVPVGYATVYLGAPENGTTPAVIESTLRSALPIVAEVRTVSQVRCAGRTTSNPNKWCQLAAQMAPEHVCPFIRTAMTGMPTLTAEQQRTARRDPRCDAAQMWGNGIGVLVDDGAAVALLTGASAADVAAATAMLRAGGVVVRDARYVKDGTATFALVERSNGSEGVRDGMERPRTVTFAAHLLTTGVTGVQPIVSPAAVARAGMSTRPAILVASTTREPTQAEADRMDQQLANISVYGSIQREPGFELPVEVWVLMAAAALITLGAAGIGTGLAAADGRADLSTLACVGATPLLRRGLSVSQAGVIAGLGSLLGAAAGLGAGTAVLAAMNRRWMNVWPGPDPLPINVPWVSLAVALLVVPLIAVLGAGLLTRSRLPIERRH